MKTPGFPDFATQNKRLELAKDIADVQLQVAYAICVANPPMLGVCSSAPIAAVAQITAASFLATRTL
jgi:hypothetical protein